MLSFTVLSFAALVSALPDAVFEAQHLNNIDHVKSSYDYIIVGGGTSALTVADRLTESGKCKYQTLK